ncbi:hypothetical protein Pelo_18961 [Pelomyxa schiedti]|nr:hypothetical protein Pelo_18961 [Pelomyxa schiedti]
MWQHTNLILITKKHGYDHCQVTAAAEPPSVSPSLLPSALVQWIKSPAMFRSWAEDWVLRPESDAVFRLPQDPCGECSYMCVSVSPTLGVVCHSYFRLASDTLCCCVGVIGPGTVVVQSLARVDHDLCSYYNYGILDVGDVTQQKQLKHGVEGATMLGASWEAVEQLKCSRNWIVGHSWSGIFILKVASGRPAGKGISLNLTAIEKSCGLRLLRPSQFSQSSVDDIFYFACEGFHGRRIVIVDLNATSQTMELVVKSKFFLCNTLFPKLELGIQELNDGTLCELDLEDSSFTLRDITTGNLRATFPHAQKVTTLDQNHVLVCNSSSNKVTSFLVYHTGDLLSSHLVESLSVPSCTWVTPSLDLSALILSTATSTDSSNNSYELSLHDGATGFHIGVFSLPHSITPIQFF